MSIIRKWLQPLDTAHRQGDRGGIGSLGLRRALNVKPGQFRRDAPCGVGPLRAHFGLRVRVPVLYLHPGFQAFQAIRTGEFLQISWTFRTVCTFKSSLPHQPFNSTG
jgi:hypothetical protein